jgi:Dolichyl-phosphate-mannose-protein mannosyltransferase
MSNHTAEISWIETDRWRATSVWLTLALIAICAVALRLGGLDWLVGVGPTPDYSFHPDDRRSVEVAANFREGSADGYVIGMATQLFLLNALLSHFGETNLAVLLRVITLFYAALSIPLTFWIARALSCSVRTGIIAAALLAVTPLHAMNSQFGTADMTAIVYFYAAWLAAAAYLRTHRQLWFVMFAALCGAAMAIKFFLPVLVPLGLVLLLDSRRSWQTQGPLAGVIAYFSFSAFSLFNYTLYDFAALWRMLRDDNLSMDGGFSTPMQLKAYVLDALPGLGLALFCLTLIGLLGSSLRGARAVRFVTFDGLRAFLHTPQGLLAAALTSHAFLIVTAEVHGERHTLIFAPMACILVAAMLGRIADALPRSSIVLAVLLVPLLAYQFLQVRAISALFRSDIRGEVAAWVDSKRASGATVYTTDRYTWVRGAELDNEDYENIARNARYYIACDLEFSRYMRDQHHASQIVHGHDAGLKLFRELFSGQSSRWRVEQSFRQQPMSFEQRLRDNGTLHGIGSFMPRRCYAFARTENASAVSTQTLPSREDLGRVGW